MINYHLNTFHAYMLTQFLKVDNFKHFEKCIFREDKEKTIRYNLRLGDSDSNSEDCQHRMSTMNIDDLAFL